MAATGHPSPRLLDHRVLLGDATPLVAVDVPAGRPQARTLYSGARAQRLEHHAAFVRTDGGSGALAAMGRCPRLTITRRPAVRPQGVLLSVDGKISCSREEPLPPGERFVDGIQGGPVAECQVHVAAPCEAVFDVLPRHPRAFAGASAVTEHARASRRSKKLPLSVQFYVHRRGRHHRFARRGGVGYQSPLGHESPTRVTGSGHPSQPWRYG